MKSFAVLFLALLGGQLSGQAQPMRAGKNTMMLRGQEQEVYYYPPPAGAANPPLVFFLPGDGGWRGDAIDMAKEVAKAGYRVHGWDIKDYLEDFTGKTHLTESEMMNDIGTVARWIRQGQSEKVVLVGWSQGAGMAVIAAASAAHKAVYGGVVAIGAPERAALGWRFADNLSYVTKNLPNEPLFSVSQYLPQIPPLRYAAINATQDGDVPIQVARRLFEAAREPRRAFTVDARGHNFGSNLPAFHAALREALIWVRGE